MLKYSIAALALVASSTFALAEPNNGASGTGMEHPGAIKGGSTEGNGASSGALRGADTKSDRNSAAEDRSGSMGKKAASDEKAEKPDRQQVNDEKANAGEKNRQANDNDRNLKNDQSKDSDHQARDNSKPDKAATGAGEGAEGKARAKGQLTGINPEQKTKVMSAFRSHRVSPEHSVGVAVNVGVVVPQTVHFYPIPEEIVTIVPDYRGYQYFMIDESHVAIVDPDSLEVVDIIVVA